jgi:hypothetical protein
MIKVKKNEAAPENAKYVASMRIWPVPIQYSIRL